jgi:hypothetical protein
MRTSRRFVLCLSPISSLTSHCLSLHRFCQAADKARAFDMEDMAKALDAINAQLGAAGCRGAEIATAVSRLTELLDQEYRRPARVRQARRRVTAPQLSAPSAKGMGTPRQSASSPNQESPQNRDQEDPHSRNQESIHSAPPSEHGSGSSQHLFEFYGPDPVSSPRAPESASQPASRKTVPILDPMAAVFLDPVASIEHLVKEYEVTLRQRSQTAHNAIAHLLSHMIYCCRRALTPLCQSRGPKPSR